MKKYSFFKKFSIFIFGTALVTSSFSLIKNVSSNFDNSEQNSIDLNFTNLNSKRKKYGFWICSFNNL
ncbi:hypothetical protein J2Z62_000726 [Mycoplasmoides fastidiosum]|uniref:Uncharacterized protein n=1 Tax=Mycoplasmoides fastidiosum TaxID=92758 RepID=A0ABU0M0B1_9BACT|nr:hypothetical protein [Mycoplasmoides fastidiosum]